VFGFAGKAHVGAAFTLIGPRPLPFQEFSNTVALLDGQLGARVGAVGLRLELTNVLDDRWRDGEFVYASNFTPELPASLLPARQFTAGAPRQFTATLEVHL
jgi:hypothetical protein